jgi:glutamyl-tRNA reductase
MRIMSPSVSHRAAPTEVLERLAVRSAELPDVLARLQARPAIREAAAAGTAGPVLTGAASSALERAQ